MRKKLIFIIIGSVIILFIAFFALDAYFTVFADECEYFILCKPGVEVNVRRTPKKGAEIIGHLELGDRVKSDGKEKNGFVHLTGLTFEFSEGWIYKGLLISERPYISEGKCQIVTDSRVAARHYINGKRKSWIKPGKEVKVYAVGKEWSITDKGYVQTRFLSLNYPEISQSANGD